MQKTMSGFAQFFAAFAVSILAHAQCYDLGSSRLYQPRGKFIERWKNSDFRVDNADWGDPMQFALFSGVIRKTSSGWQPYHATRRVWYLCEPGIQPNGGWKCFEQPYFPPTPEAKSLRYPRIGSESWSLSTDGIFRYEKKEIGAMAPKGEHEKSIEGVLDLNKGQYELQMNIHAAGVHLHLKKEGIELWREQPFHAVVRLREVPCPVKVETASLRSLGIESADTAVAAAPPCVVRVRGSGSGAAVPAAPEFLLNPRGAASAEGCVLVFDTPARESGIAGAENTRSETGNK